MLPVPPGRISSLASSVGPSRTSAAGSVDWFEIVTVASPAPTAAAVLGLTLTELSLIKAVSSIGDGGRGLFSKSSSPQAAIANAAATAATGKMSLLPTLIPRATLTEALPPERWFAASERQVHDLGIDPVADRDRCSRLGLPAADRQRDRAARGGADRRTHPAQLTLAQPERVAGGDLGREPQPAKAAVGLSLVLQPGDGLLADVAALSEADRALVDPGLLGDRRSGHLATESRAPALDANDLRRLL